MNLRLWVLRTRSLGVALLSWFSGEIDSVNHVEDLGTELWDERHQNHDNLILHWCMIFLRNLVSFMLSYSSQVLLAGLVGFSVNSWSILWHYITAEQNSQLLDCGMQMENKLDKITSVLPLDISSTVSLTDYSIKNFNTGCFRSELALLTHYLYVAGDNTSCAV